MTHAGKEFALPPIRIQEFLYLALQFCPATAGVNDTASIGSFLAHIGYCNRLNVNLKASLGSFSETKATDLDISQSGQTNAGPKAATSLLACIRCPCQ